MMESEAPSARVIEAVAQETGESPLELSPPLFESIDPDALDALVASASTDVHVTFDYTGYEVQICGDGTVSARSKDDRT